MIGSPTRMMTRLTPTMKRVKHTMYAASMTGTATITYAESASVRRAVLARNESPSIAGSYAERIRPLGRTRQAPERRRPTGALFVRLGT
jgi:hypothetical protein